MIIDASNLIIGRLGTFVAKKALLGETIDIINCEKAVVTGEKKRIQTKYKQIRERGAPLVGPFFPKQSDRFVKRTIRGMLPYKQPKGVDAFKRIICHKGVPAEFEGKNAITIKEADITKVINTKYLTVEEVCKFLGGN